MKHLKNFQKYNESVDPLINKKGQSTVHVNSTNYDNCVEVIPNCLDENGVITLQVHVDKKDDGTSTYEKLIDRLGLEERTERMSGTEPGFSVEVTFR